MSERMQWLARLQSGERMTDLCREFGIRRTTDYKLQARFEAMGSAGLIDASRAPKRVAHRTSRKVRELLRAARHKHPTLLRAWLLFKQPGLVLPAASTMRDL
jgi:Helix-turn-helix domain